MTAPLEAHVRAAWEALADHSFTCAECRDLQRRQSASSCPAEWALYRAWKVLWVEAGHSAGLAGQVPA